MLFHVLVAPNQMDVIHLLTTLAWYDTGATLHSCRLDFLGLVLDRHLRIRGLSRCYSSCWSEVVDAEDRGSEVVNIHICQNRYTI